MTNTTNKTLAILAALSVAACSSDAPDLHAADYADAGSTALVIAQGGVEMNPIVGVAGDAAAPLVSLGLKYTLRNGLPYVLDMTQGQADATADMAGWLGACNNIAVLAGASFPASLIPGVGCLILSGYSDRADIFPTSADASQ